MDNGMSDTPAWKYDPNAIEDDEDPPDEVISCMHVLGAYRESPHEGWRMFMSKGERAFGLDRIESVEDDMWDFDFCPNCGERLIVDAAP